MRGCSENLSRLSTLRFVCAAALVVSHSLVITPATAQEARAAAEAEDELEMIVLPRDAALEEAELLDGDLDEDLDDSILDANDETDADRLARLFTLYMDAVADRQFDEADTLAKQIVEQAIRTYGLDSTESAKALTNLGIAQHGIGDYESAILNYEAAIGVFERVEDRLSYSLINPLRGLGAAQLANGRPDLARDSFNRAVHISHVAEGPHNMEQIEALEALAETYLSVGERNEAIDVQKRIYYLQARNVDTRSLDILPALRTRAGFQHRMQLFDQERFTWRRIISIIEQHKGKDSLDLIDPLTSLGHSFMFIGVTENPYQPTASVSSGEVYLKRAVRVAEANPDADWSVLPRAMLELGDYYMRSARPNRGHRVYEEAWRLLSEGEDSEKLALRAALLEKPVALTEFMPPRMYGGDPAVPVSGQPAGFETGVVQIEYRVSMRGQPMNIKLVRADPEGLEDMYQAVARELRRIQHRPSLRDGEVVMSDATILTHEYFYRPADIEVPPDAETTTAGNP
ncbi:MAG: tetratricopeptide repeat protein [Pseudomonadota bacterium]